MGVRQKTRSQITMAKYTKITKEVECDGCHKTFQAKKKSGTYGTFQSYCDVCTKEKVWLRGISYSSKYKYISDEGVVIK